MTADSLKPLGIRNWCAQQAADIAPSLPLLTSLRVSIGNYEPAHCVTVSGFHADTRRHVSFSGETVAEAAEAARQALSNPQPTR
jgi:hypothetical protein